ncbi:MAG: hypothetical protein IPH51_07680 [Rubrivivax sp.]|nr:hypothetical protein [Rubrivivax sp.]
MTLCNAWAGRAEAIALGQRLFFAKRLSPDARLACASPATSARAGFLPMVARGRSGGSNSSATRHRHRQAVRMSAGGWDGAADVLWSQALRPCSNRVSWA